MKALVTGSCGFIGSHLCERLIKDGHLVIGFDDLSNGSIDNIKAIKNHNNFRLFLGDITKGHLEGKFDEFDWIFHLSALADIVPSIKKPLRYHQANVDGTLAVLELARKVNIKKFIYAASSSCYGIPDQYPTPETAPCRPMYPYALTKYVGEQYVMHWARTYKVPAVSLRLFNVYGPRSRTSGAYGAVFGTFLAQIANGSPLTIVGDGTQSRDFTYVTDVVDAFIEAAESKHVAREFNIGSGHPHSVNELANLLGAKDIVYIPKRPGEPQITSADFKEAAYDLGWMPNISFQDGVAKMKALIPEYKDAPLWTPEKIEQATKQWFEALS